MTLAQYVDQQGQPVRLGKELGRGGQGAVYEISGQAGTVAKIYLKRPDPVDVLKLVALSQVSTPQLLSVSAWPQVILRDPTGQIQGFVMPLVSDTEYHELHNLYRITSRRQAFPQADVRFLVHVARNVSRAFTVLHSRDLLMGDVSSRNVMVSQNGTVRLIDTDSFQITVGGRTYPCPVGTAEFTAPELQGKSFGTLVRTREHDLFGLALLIFHLLFDGRHPYAGIHDNGAMPSPAEAIKTDKFAYSLQYQHGVKPPPFTLTLQGVHSSVRNLFERAFSPKHQNRPQADEWDKVLAEVFRHLTTCSKNAAHKYDSRIPCPWCAMLPANAQAATAKTGIPSAAKRIDVEAELNRIWSGVQNIQRPAPPTQMPVITPAPLPLPAQPAIANIPAPSVPTPNGIYFSGWGILFALISFSTIFEGNWAGFVFFAVLSLYNFAKKNAPAAVKERQEKQMATLQQAHQKQVEQAKTHQHQAYRLTLRASLSEHQQELKQLKDHLTQAQTRQQSTSAESQYRAALAHLEDLRKAVRDIERQEQEKLAEVVKRHRKSMLDQHLQSNIIQPGVIAGVGPALIASLNQKGIYTAKDIREDVRWIKGVGPKRQQDLQAWRDMLEQFYQFNPNSVPPREFEVVRNQMDHERKSKLTQLETAANKLKSDMADWKNADDTISREIHALKTKILQREKTIEMIERGINIVS